MAGAKYLVGRGLADITGEAAECGMLGYGKAEQKTEGIHTRQRSRAFIFAEPNDGARVLLVVNDLPLVFDSVHQAVLARLARHYGSLYSVTNTMITATHTHCGPGGYSHHLLYNTTTGGFRPKTFNALVDGICEAVTRAHNDLGEATLSLAHGELHNASANRSKVAFDRNPQEERDFFPGAIDPQTTLLRIERGGEVVGVVNWFPTHCTNMTNQNLLISSDNKGYAGYFWERVVHGVDYLADLDDDPGFIAAFAQTNAGDMSPNLDLQPGCGPTDDEFANTKIIGRRQYDAAAALLSATGVALTGPIDARVICVDLSDVEVRAEFTRDGRTHRTSAPCGGSASLAGSWEDGRGFGGFEEGVNPKWDWLSSKVFYRLFPRLADSQAPKGIVLPGGLLNRLLPMVAERALIQLLRVGHLYLIGIPGEATITAGLRLRRTVAEIVGADLKDVLVAGYSNGYIHYVTTPEEYDAQQYEGGSTLFGRWELPALQQVVAQLATALRNGKSVDLGGATKDLSAKKNRKTTASKADVAPVGGSFGQVLAAPAPTYRLGDRVNVTFAGAHPNNHLRRGDTYLDVERHEGGTWCVVADDGDWSTRFRWRRMGEGRSIVTVTWDIGEEVSAGTYRIRYHGDALDERGAIREVLGTTEPFRVVPGP